ncbi:kelch repeat-containing protein [Bacillus horti]|uniref:N-acetylneuraminic acid mutarotase n=1 Tax=Caldalkalibacillus horti TaxID=77523 RepID=A0ABT9VX25_9BACI|nr:kelch repeat-containing protein [Bacillus horti]MDQ0165362.1 N-acetylneuraminic acid mutarotase [Bacillus horti]
MKRRFTLILISTLIVSLLLPTHGFKVGASTSWELEDFSLPEATISSGTAYMDGKIYVAGGAGVDNSISNSFYAFDLTTRQWHNLADLPQPLQGHSLIPLFGKLYVIGGNAGNIFSNQVYEYDPTTNEWEAKSPLPTGLSLYNSAVLNNKIYIFGGLTSGAVINSILEYDPISDIWTDKNSKALTYLYRASASSNGKVYFFGGESATFKQPQRNVSVFDPEADTFNPELYPDGTGSTWSFRLRSAAVSLPDGDLMVMGGQQLGNTVTDLVHIYNPSTNSWSDGERLPVPLHNTNSLLISEDDSDYVLILGGQDTTGDILSTVYMKEIERPLELDLNAVDFNVADGTLTNTTSAMEYSLAGGIEGSWVKAEDVTTLVDFVPGMVYVREAADPLNNRFVGFVTQPNHAPDVQVDVSAGMSELKLLGATEDMEYTTNDGAKWRVITPGIASGEATIDASGEHDVLRVRYMATKTALPSPPTIQLNVEGPQLSSDASLQSITLTGINLTSTVTADVYNYTALLTTLSQTSAHLVTGSPAATVKMFVNGEEVQNPIELALGKNKLAFEVTAEDGTKETYRVSVEREASKPDGEIVNPGSGNPGGGSSGGGLPAGGSNSITPPRNGIDIYVDGVKQPSFASARTEQINGRETMLVTVDSAKVLEKLEQNESKIVTIPVTGDQEVVSAKLNGLLFKKMKGENVLIELVTDRATYSLPTSLVDVPELTQQLEAGNHDRLDEELNIEITISLPDETTLMQVYKDVNNLGQSVIGEPVEFGVYLSFDGKQIEVSRFSEYVERLIPIPNDVEPTRITTGVVLGADGELYHVPTKVITQNGNHFAQINSLTNSVYAVIWNPQTFEDVKQHWSEDEVNDMASRKIVHGVRESVFDPNRSVTRAEFTVMVVRALGLRPDVSNSALWRDVELRDWYANDLRTALEYGLVEGYENSSFQPLQTISRAEASAILANALNVAKYEVELTAEQSAQILATFKDSKEVATWAMEGVTTIIQAGILQGDHSLIRSREELTRAQATVMLHRLLQTTDLINY